MLTTAINLTFCVFLDAVLETPGSPADVFTLTIQKLRLFASSGPFSAAGVDIGPADLRTQTRLGFTARPRPPVLPEEPKDPGSAGPPLQINPDSPKTS